MKFRLKIVTTKLGSIILFITLSKLVVWIYFEVAVSYITSHFDFDYDYMVKDFVSSSYFLT